MLVCGLYTKYYIVITEEKIMFKKNSRTDFVVKNLMTGIVAQVLVMLLSFATRTVFVRVFGEEYLGINGLFSNILSVLSLAELGIGNAIIFQLYKPLADKNYKRITQFMTLYKWAYRGIGILIVLLGLFLIPFLPVLIKDYNSLNGLGINAILLFILYLMQAVSSYLFFSYKSSIIRANQQEYILNIVSYIITILTNITQMVVILVFKDFLLYTATIILYNIIMNFINAKIADKMFPVIKEKVTKLSHQELKNIFKDCFALFIYKVNSVVLKATDNIVLSSFLGLKIVGIYSNYLMIYTAIKSILSKIYESLTASLGNMHATEKIEYEIQIFKSISLLTAILYGIASVGIATIANEFINIWIGNAYVIPQPFPILIGLEIYTVGLRTMYSKYRTTMGLFQQGKYRPLAGMIINIIFSVILVQYIGIHGVLIGTIVADWSTVVWYDPYILYKYFLEKSIL